MALKDANPIKRLKASTRQFAVKKALTVGLPRFDGFTLPKNARKPRLNRFCGVFWFVPYPSLIPFLKGFKRPYLETRRQAGAWMRLKGFTLNTLFRGWFRGRGRFEGKQVQGALKASTRPTKQVLSISEPTRELRKRIAQTLREINILCLKELISNVL